jgi:hypothetical protein
MSTTVSVTALKYHTENGREHHEGDVYTVDASHVENLVAQGMVRVTEAHAATQTKPSRPVPAMTTADFGITPKPKG